MKTTAKKTLSVLLSLLIVLSVFAGMTFTAGAANTYQISSYAELKAFADAVNGGETDANAILTADIIAEGTDWTPIGNDSKRFIGTFDGDGHTITGLSTESNAGLSYVGLFGCIGAGGVVQHVGLNGGSIKGNNNVGAVAGENWGKIVNCYNTGAVTSTDIGIAIGGIVGRNYSDIIGCFNTGTVTQMSKIADVGGIVGFNNASQSGTAKVTGCYNTGAVTVTGVDVFTGGIAGHNCGADGRTATVADCYNTGAVTVTGNESYLGGIVGYTEAGGGIGEVTGCYNMGAVTTTGSNNLLGGIAGINKSGTVTNCYYDRGEDNGIGTKLTTAQMTAGTYTDDDVTNMPGLSSEKWLVRQSNEFIAYYPHLKGFAYDITGAVKDWPAKLTLLSLDDAKVAAIDDAATVAEVVTALEGAKAEIDKIKTDAELSAEEAAALAAAKAAAKAELANYKNADDYRDAQKNELAAAITAGNEAIDSAATVAEVEAALADAKAAIDRIKTDAELSSEEAATEETADEGPGVCEYCGETHDVNTFTGFFTDMLHDMLYIIMRLTRFFSYDIFVS